MSKIVVVFSTYYIHRDNIGLPEDLFSSIKPIPFNKNKICNFLWNRILDDRNAIESAYDSLTDEWREKIDNESKKKKVDAINEIKKEIINRKDSFQDLIKRLNLEKIAVSNEDFKWLRRLLMMIMKPDLSSLVDGNDKMIIEDLVNRVKVIEDPDSTVFKKESLKEYNKLGQLKNCFRMVGNKTSFNISQEKIRDRDDYDSEPWFYNRMSYYKLEGEDVPSDIAVYAVWSLDLCSAIFNKEGYLEKSDWVDALVDQFRSLNSDIEELYLILHDKDLFSVGTSAKVVDNKTLPKEDNKVFQMTIAIFQHSDSTGTLLKGKHSAEEVLNHVRNNFSLLDILYDISDSMAIESNPNIIKNKIKELKNKLENKSLLNEKEDWNKYFLGTEKKLNKEEEWDASDLIEVNNEVNELIATILEIEDGVKE